MQCAAFSLCCAMQGNVCLEKKYHHNCVWELTVKTGGNWMAFPVDVCDFEKSGDQSQKNFLTLSCNDCKKKTKKNNRNCELYCTVLCSVLLDVSKIHLFWLVFWHFWCTAALSKCPENHLVSVILDLTFAAV